MANGERTSASTMILGWAFILLAGWVVWRVGVGVKEWAFPEPRITAALSASFTGTPPAFRVLGRVQEGGMPVAAGTAKVTVEWIGGPFLQTVLLDIKDGTFQISGGPPFDTLSPDASLRVAADIELPSRTQVSEELFLNTPRPRQAGLDLFVLQALGWTIVACGVMFFWAFTGMPSRLKNQVAIILSYCMIIVALAIPLLTPVVMPIMFPDVDAAMHQAAVGIVVAKPYSTNDDSPAQWSLNIGGYVVEDAPAAVPASRTPAPPPANLTAPAAATRAPAVVSVAQRDTPVVPAAPAEPVAADDTQAQTGTEAIDAPVDAAAKATEMETPAAPGSKVVRIQGGVVVPLYVMILSVIGGAINMTRQVPRFQQRSALLDGTFARLQEQVRASLHQPMKTVGALMNMAKPAPSEATPAADDAAAPAPPVPDTPESAATPPAAADEGEPSQNGWAEWRAGLLNQYMYLLSAPFLAIATYHLLASLDLIKQPIVVMVSFSIGLISEKVIRAILYAAERVLPSKGNPAGSEEAPAEA